MPRGVRRNVGRIVLAIREVPVGSTGWPLHGIESRLLSGGFASDSLSQAPAHLSGAGRHGIRRGRSDRLQHLLAVARELGAADAADLCQFVERRRPLAGDAAQGGVVEDHVGRHALFARQRSEEHTSELQSLMRISYAVLCLKKKNKRTIRHTRTSTK